MLLFQNENRDLDENHLVSTETITGQAPAWDREMMFETESLGDSSSGMNPNFNRNSGVKSLFRCLYLIFVFLQSFDPLVRSNLWVWVTRTLGSEGELPKLQEVKKSSQLELSWAGWWLWGGDYQQGWQEGGILLTTPGSAQPPGSRKEKSQSSFVNVSGEQCGMFSGTDCGVTSFKKSLFRGSWAATLTWFSSEVQIKPLPNQTFSQGGLLIDTLGFHLQPKQEQKGIKKIKNKN